MIIATVKMRGRAEKRRELMQTVSGIADQVRQAHGCVGVDCYQDINDENIIYHVEEWLSRQDLDNHMKSKLFSALLGIKTILHESPEVSIMIKDHLG